jgi:DNA-directed RNA polymerase beta subunit
MAYTSDAEGELLRQVVLARGGSQPVLDSVNHFYKYRIGQILAAYNLSTIEGHIGTFTNPFIVRPTINDLKGGGKSRALWPYEARRNSQSYMAQLFAKFQLNQNINGRLVPIPDQTIDVYLGKIPAIVQSEVCHLYGLTQEERYIRGEPEKDPGAYAIIKGGEKVLLNIENLRTSEAFLYEDKEEFTVRYTSQSLTDTTVNIIKEDKDDIHVTFSKMGISNNSINVFYIFYVLGFSNSRIVEKVFEMMDNFIIDDDPQRQARRRKEMRYYMQTTVNTYLYQTGNNQEQIYTILSGKIHDKTIINSPNRNNLIMDLIWRELFKNVPLNYRDITELNQNHMTELVPILATKARMLAGMIVKYVDFKNGYRNPDDRDSWGNKQLVDSGKHLAKAFARIWKLMITNMQGKVTSNRLTTALQIKNAINQNYMTEQFINSYNKELFITGKGQRETAIVDTLKRDNILAANAHIRRISTPTNRRAKIRDKRLIHNTQWGVVCPVMTPEGEACLDVDTLVLLANGKEIRIGDIKDGDEILTINPYTLEESPSKIHSHFIKSAKEYSKPILKITALNGREIICTDDHPFLTQSGLSLARDLDITKHALILYNQPDSIYSLEGLQEKLLSMNINVFVRNDCVLIPILKIEEYNDCMVADFTTENDNHTMIANGFVTHNCGLVKDTAITAYVSLDRDETVVRARLDGRQLIPRATIVNTLQGNVIQTESGVQYAIPSSGAIQTSEGIVIKSGAAYSVVPTNERRNPLYLNGIHLGFCNSAVLREELLHLRRTQQLYFDTGIVLDQYKELKIFTNEGRICRPLLIVDKDTQELVIDIKGLRGANLETLMNEGALEYIDIAEQEQVQILIAETVRHIRNRREELTTTVEQYERLSNDTSTPRKQLDDALLALERIQTRMKYTHCEIDPTAILGISAISMPFAEFNPGPRDTYQAGMVRQALGGNSSRIELRFDTTMKTIIEPGVPTVSTDAHEFLGLDLYPGGHELVIAITTYGGSNQEDGITFNKTAIDLGLFLMMIYHSYKTTVCQSTKHQERIRIPDYPRNQADRYSKLDTETGIVRVGEYVKSGDCLVGKVIIGSDGQVKNDSLYVEVGKEGIVDEVYVTENAESCKLIRIRLRELRKLQPGDKLASRYSQKGTIGAVLPESEMPWIVSENPHLNGVKPHVIFNPHGIPSRMTMGKLYEILVGKATSVTAERFNATAFRRFGQPVKPGEPVHNNIYLLKDQLELMGFSRSGKEKMVNGITGREMDVDIYVGTAYYQLLRHLVKDKMQARGTGTVQFLTRQPTSGIRKEGGLRLGEMERDALLDYGASYLQQERMNISSDAYQAIVCKDCGMFAATNMELGVPRCRKCHTGTFTRVTIPYAFKLLTHYLAAANMRVKLRTKEI